MYKLNYWMTNSLASRTFKTLAEALRYSVYKIPFMSFHGIDKEKE